MLPKLVQLYKNQGLSGDAGDHESYSIKTVDQILTLYLNVRCQNGANHNSADAAVQQNIEEALSLIEVKSGSTVFKSYTGEACRKLALYRDGKMPPTLYSQAGGTTWAGSDDPTTGWQEFTFPIHFTPRNDPYGRRTNTCLPAPVYRDNVDLDLTYDFTLNADAGFATGTAKFDLYALTVPPESSQAMLNKNILVETKKADHTTLATGDHEMGLTVDRSTFLRHVYLTCYKAGVAEGVSITDVKFRINNETKWEGKWGAIQKVNAMDCKMHPHLYNIHTKANTTDDEIYTRVPAVAPTFTAKTTTSEDAFLSQTADKVTINSQSADDLGILGVRSPVVPAMIVLDFDKDCSFTGMPGGHPNNSFGHVQDMDIVVVQAAAGGDCDLVEQYIKKPWNL